MEVLKNIYIIYFLCCIACLILFVETIIYIYFIIKLAKKDRAFNEKIVQLKIEAIKNKIN